MSEKVLIQSCINKTAKDNSSYQSIMTADGRKFTSWNSDFAPYLNKEVEVNITQSGNFWNIDVAKQTPQQTTTTQQITIDKSKEVVVQNLVNALVDFVNLFKQ
jgi:hypothetical protein